MIIEYFFSKRIIIEKVFGAVEWIEMNLKWSFVGYLVIFLYLVNHLFLYFLLSIKVYHNPSR